MGVQSTPNTSTNMSGSAAAVSVVLAKKKGRDNAEVKALEAAFKKVDLNKDGRVDIDEYVNILESRGLNIDAGEVKQMFALADKNGDSVLDRAEVNKEIRRLNDVDTAFKAMDKNKIRQLLLISRDSFVDSREMEASTKLNEKQAKAAVKVCDKDDDGVLNKSEFHSMINRNKSKNPEVEKGDRMFDQLDTNKDGFLTSQELSKSMDASQAYLVTHSKRVDKNRDGKLDREEFRDFMGGRGGANKK